MRKIMEVYVADNGLIVKNYITKYHLFGTSIQEDTESVTIGNAKDAFVFLCNFFADKLKIDRKKKITMTSLDEVIEFRLMLEEEEIEKAEYLAKIEELNYLNKFIGMIVDEKIAGSQEDAYYLACKHFKHEIENRLARFKESK